MLFTWDTTNLCIVFRSWRITGLISLILSLVAVMALTAGYEAVREASRRYEAKHTKLVEEMPSKFANPQVICEAHHAFDEDGSTERSSLLAPGSSVAAQEKSAKAVKAAFYGVQVFYSFFIM